ncbi:uncharacterized protein METZ01_LOCUS288180 [marine metagenome]|uniref:Uncharacterized protein n=1 Tax=marine metagenome TaxID=408172 RepID=A0A382LFC3_9ZZZZ
MPASAFIASGLFSVIVATPFVISNKKWVSLIVSLQQIFPWPIANRPIQQDKLVFATTWRSEGNIRADLQGHHNYGIMKFVIHIFYLDGD